MSVLIDTSVWIDHFRNRNDVLVDLIELDLALAHPMVIVEIACGTPPGLGCGLVDISLLASTLITPGAELWTLDKRLDELAERFGVAHLPTLH